MIRIENLHYKYISYEKSEGLMAAFKDFLVRNKVEMLALNNINLSILPGEMVGLLGPNGAGKTTLMKVLIGLIHPTSGNVSVMDDIPYKKNNDFLKKIGIVLGQKSQLIWDLPPVDTFKMLKEIYEISNEDYQNRLTTLSNELGVAEKMHTPVRKLSLGERMKCELIASFLHKPTLLLLDEPTIGLDIGSQKAIYNFLITMNSKENTTIITTSHYINDIKALCNRLIILLDGTVHYDGNTEELLREYRTDEIVIKVNLKNESKKHIIGNKYKYKEKDSELSIIIERSEISKLLSFFVNEEIEIESITSEDAPLEEVIFNIFSKGEIHDKIYSGF